MRDSAEATSNPELVEQAIVLAGLLQKRANELRTAGERHQQAALARMLKNPGDKATLLEMTDQAFRAHSARRTVDQFAYLLEAHGIPEFFSPLQRGLLNGFRFCGSWWPSLSRALLWQGMREQTRSVVLPAESPQLGRLLEARRRQRLRLNVNFLGEALLGEGEAKRRLERYLEALQAPELEVLSVKISTLYSQISALAREETIAALCDRLEVLYRTAAHLHFTRPDGSQVPKFIYLDMEEYRDMRLTAEAFMRTLSRPGLEMVRAGIALQAYLPDSIEVQREIISWARHRFRTGGAPVTIRLVKGANLEMERVEASLRGWPQAPFLSKLETDANFKRMLHQGLESLPAVQLGIGSHNLFDVAYGLLLATKADPGSRVQFEMLEGMANHQRRALVERYRQLLLYAPACRREEFVHAIGYLIRRLDENTGPQNFLRHVFELEVGSPDWQRLETEFKRACHLVPSDQARRVQDRRHESCAPIEAMSLEDFRNEPDTDFALVHNSQWAREVVTQGVGTIVEGARQLMAQATAQLHGTQRSILDPSRPRVLLAKYREAGRDDADMAVSVATEDPDGWRSLGVQERCERLGAVAAELRNSRAQLILAAIANGGKTFLEADAEVSEAVDFVEFYRAAANQWNRLPTVRVGPRGTILVISPWNFPIAIPCGGISAALAAGNTVIFKPSSESVLVGAELWRCFMAAGISPKTLQFLPCSGATIGPRLASNPKIATVLLTGGTATAQTMLQQFPAMPLVAETGGKNATIVTALSDREQAIAHLIQSAFSHSGQKCSATSLLLLEDEVYDDPAFKRTLCDAVSSMKVGSAWNLATRIGPLIRPPTGALEAALKTLEHGESWALLPEHVNGNPNLWSPGIKWGVQPGSPTHLTELFGPILSVMRFSSLEEAIGLVHQTGYGLTSGLESLDVREQIYWRQRIRAGNLYMNRPTTGAIVLRQPFGGVGKSSFGPGFKTGGPNYLVPLLDFEDVPVHTVTEEPEPCWNQRLEESFASPTERERMRHAFGSYRKAWAEEFSREHDHFRLLGEDNVRRYRSMGEIRIRVDPRDSLFEIVARIRAAELTGAQVLVSSASLMGSAPLRAFQSLIVDWATPISLVEESDESLAKLIRNKKIERLRFAAPDRVPASVRQAAAEAGAYLADAPVLAEGRLELLWYLSEQSISSAYHRHGNLGRRQSESRHEPS